MNVNNINRKKFRNVFLVQNRDYWKSCPFPYGRETDLVLSFDFAVVNEINSSGGSGAYIDHLADKKLMQRLNHVTYDFFKEWYIDKEKKDIFSYKNIDFGNAFWLEIWNDVTYYVRLFANIHKVKKLSYENIYLGLNDLTAITIARNVIGDFKEWSDMPGMGGAEYYFPIHRWLQEKIYPEGMRNTLKNIVCIILDKLFQFQDYFCHITKNKSDIYIHRYHPTNRIYEEIKRDGKVNVITENYSFHESLFGQRRIPHTATPRRLKNIAQNILRSYCKNRATALIINGIDISGDLHSIIAQRIEYSIASYLNTIEKIFAYFSGRRLKLVVTITNIKKMNCLIQNYCRYMNIPTYMIINGLMLHSFEFDAKIATWINSYGASIKNKYFRGMENIVCLGDPRMDDYLTDNYTRNINYNEPTIVIGAAGFSNIDLNSYVAFEFDFLNDILSVCRDLIAGGKKMNIILKVRPNGYKYQYEKFIKEYYPEIPVSILDQAVMRQVLKKADLYITIFSQTLMEASCLRIPVIYYKKDTQYLYPPFDGKSELVVAYDIKDLAVKISKFYTKSPIFNKFMDKKVLEKYVGPLDGCNLKRNIDYIYSKIFKIDNEECRK